MGGTCSDSLEHLNFVSELTFLKFSTFCHYFADTFSLLVFFVCVLFLKTEVSHHILNLPCDFFGYLIPLTQSEWVINKNVAVVQRVR